MNTNPDPTERELEGLAMNIVFQIGDALYEALPSDIAHKYFVDARQATNDAAIDFAKKLILADRQTQKQRLLARIGSEVIGKNIDHADYCDLRTSDLAYYNPEDVTCSCSTVEVNEIKVKQRTALQNIERDGNE